MKFRIFITGGAGFIGANTAAYYLSQGHSVTIYDNLSRPGVKHNLDWLRQTYPPSRLKIIIDDVRNLSRLQQTIKLHQVVIHLAGQTAVTTSITAPQEDFLVNALGTFNVLEATRQTTPQAIFIYASTNKVYGDMSRLHYRRRTHRYYAVESASIDESESLNFYSPYGCSKGAGDQYVHDYYRIYGLRTVVFRQSCIYGAHQFGVEDQGWVAHFTAQAIKRRPITIYGDGRQVRDMLYITDLIVAYDQAIKNIRSSAGQIYNIGGGIDNSASLLELIGMLEELTGRSIQLKFQSMRQGDQKVYISNIDKARRDLTWQPHVSIDQGLQLLYDWLKDFLDQ